MYLVKRASLLRPGDQFIFAEDMGGEGQVVTVTGQMDLLGTIVIETLELNFDIELGAMQLITLKEN